MDRRAARRRILATLREADPLEPADANSPPAGNKSHFQFAEYRVPPRYGVTFLKSGLSSPVREKPCGCGSPTRGQRTQCCHPHGPMSGIVATCSWDATVRVWDVATGRCLGTGSGHAGPIYCSALLPGDRLVTGSGDMTLKVWNVAEAEDPMTYQRHFYPVRPLLTCVGHTWPVNCVCVAPKMIISGSGDKTLKVWHPKTGRCRGTLVGHTSSVDCCAPVVHAPARLASGSYDGTIRVWDLQTGVTLATLTGHQGPVNCLAGLPDGRLCSGSGDNTIRLWDLRMDQCTAQLKGHKAAVTTLAPFGDAGLLSGGRDLTILRWDTSRGMCELLYDGHTAPLTAVSPLGPDFFASGAEDATARVWDVSQGHCCMTLEGHEGYVTGVHKLSDAAAGKPASTRHPPLGLRRFG